MQLFFMSRAVLVCSTPCVPSWVSAGFLLLVGYPMCFLVRYTVRSLLHFFVRSLCVSLSFSCVPTCIQTCSDLRIAVRSR